MIAEVVRRAATAAHTMQSSGRRIVCLGPPLRGGEYVALDESYWDTGQLANRRKKERV